MDRHAPRTARRGGQPGTPDSAAQNAETHVGHESVEKSDFSRLERLALVIGAFDWPDPDTSHRRLTRLWGVLRGGNRPKQLANGKLEALRQLASVISHKRMDLRSKAELAVRALGYNFRDIETFVERLRAGAVQRTGQP